MASRARRRVVLAAAAVVLLPLDARAQFAKTRRIGILMPSTAPGTADLVDAFEQGLKERGYQPGRNIALEYRYSEGRMERVPALASELVAAGAEVIMSPTDEVVRLIKQRVPAIPIVMVNSGDPVRSGLVESLARPGGNVTGISNLSPEITAKRLELLKEAIPGLVRVAYLWNPRLPGAEEVYGELESAARLLRLELRSAPAPRAEDIAAAFAALSGGPTAAVIVQAPNPVLYTARKRIAELAREKRLASMFNRWEYVAAGGLISYGPNVREMYRRAAYYVDEILKGARPAAMPVEQPTQFELAINPQTATELGIAIPRSLLLRADKTL
jgi:putative ABC transport system substrate-binding protein